MNKKLILSSLSVLLLAACTINSSQITPSLIHSPAAIIDKRLPSAGTALPTLTPTLTPSPTPTSEVHLESGEQAFFNGDYSRAQIEFQQALTNATDLETRIAALWGLGRVEYVSGNNNKALTDLKDLVDKYPESPKAAWANFIIGEIYMTLERYDDASKAYKSYLAQRPGVLDNNVHERLGDAFKSAENYAEAISAYEAALAAPHISDDTDLQIKTAQAYISFGDTTTALERFDSISKASSNDYVKAQMDLLTGRLLLSLGLADQAYEQFLDAVNNYYFSYDAYSALVTLVNANVPVDDLYRGLTDYYASKYGYALDAFQRYINANPQNDGTASYYHAMSQIKLDNFQVGVDELTNFIANYPGNKNWQSAWGVKAETQWLELGNNVAAAQTNLEYAKTNIMVAPQALLNAGRNYERADRLDDAARVWESIADTFPGSDLVPQALFLAGIARYRLARYDQALLTFQRDLQFSTTAEDQARAYFWIGKTQLVLANSAEAQTSWKQASSLDATEYYSLRAQDMLLKRSAFASPPATNFSVDLATERTLAEAWLRVTFNLPPDTDLSTPGDLLSDPRLVRGTEFWTLGLQDKARLEFDDLSTAVQENPANSYRLANYLLDRGLYYSAITDIRQVLKLAGMTTQSQTLAAPLYFNHIRYGLYYRDLVIPAAEQYGFDSLFLFSIIRHESLFNKYAVSIDGALGLMQIWPPTGQGLVDQLGWPPDYTTKDLYRPNINLSLGTYFLAGNRKYYNGDLYAALAKYNSTPTNTDFWISLSGNDQDLFVEVIRILQTSDYIRSIYEIYSMYRSLYGTIP